MPFTSLLPLITGGKLPRALSDILSQVLGGGMNPNIVGKLQDLLQNRLEEQQGRSGARLLARSLLELIDATMEDQSSGASVEQRTAIVTELTNNAALQLSQAADLLMGYPKLQAAVVQAKQPGGTPAALQAAREERNAHAERVKQALIDVGRVAAGDKPRDL